jgi:hypothetical protein
VKDVLLPIGGGQSTKLHDGSSERIGGSTRQSWIIEYGLCGNWIVALLVLVKWRETRQENIERKVRKWDQKKKKKKKK